MAPTKRGGASATAKRKPKNAVKPIEEGQKPTKEEKEEEDPPTKKTRRSARNASQDKPNVEDHPSVDNNGAETHSVSPSNNNTSTRNIIIEHCKQCQSFKVRALKVEKEIKGAIPDVDVTINPEKPRKGCFEIRDGKGNIFLSLQNMPRPFTKLKQWDLDATITDVIEKIK